MSYPDIYKTMNATRSTGSNIPMTRGTASRFTRITPYDEIG